LGRILLARPLHRLTRPRCPPEKPEDPRGHPVRFESAPPPPSPLLSRD
uniref:Uncharacterized protein n=1 Tax=Gasterosteus aculeatus TaxID=69293 RepID=G3NSB8_GASAC